MWDGMRVISVCFSHAPSRQTDRDKLRFLLFLQEVQALGKTRNKLYGSNDLQTPEDLGTGLAMVRITNPL
jgi:hypothetical protein